MPLFDIYISRRTPTSAPTTIKKFRTSYNHFEKYLEWSSQKFKASIITQDLYEDFVNYLLEQKGLVNNSVGAIVKNWRVFLRDLQNKGFIFDADLSKFKVFSGRSDIVALTREELNLLEAHAFSKNKSLDQVRDVFVVSCHTGYRYSDMKRLGKEHIVNGKINLTAYKNLKPTYVPLSPRVKQIFEKYDYKLPIISSQRFNEYIKIACEQAGITRQTETLTVKGGKKIFKTSPKHELISAHRAVSTFITICRDNRMPAELVAQIVGKTAKVIEQHYYQVQTDRVDAEYTRVWVDPVMKVSK